MKPPEHLTAGVAAVWSELYPALGARADRLAGPEFEAYCTAVARLRDAQKRIQDEELIVPDSKGAPTAHPAFAVERQCMDELRRWGSRFNKQ